MSILKKRTRVSKRSDKSAVSIDASAYRKIMAEIEQLMSKGSKNVTKNELAKIRSLALTAQAYEKSKFVIAPPTTFAGIIEMKMYELNLKQKEVAQKLAVSETKLSMILNGKQKPDINFLIAIYSKLNIDPGLLLDITARSYGR